MRLAALVVMAAALASAAAAQAPSQRVLFPGLEGHLLLDAVRPAYRPPFTLGQVATVAHERRHHEQETRAWPRNLN